MPTLNELIIKEIEKDLERKPKPSELLDAALWLGEHITEKSDFLDYEYYILTWSKKQKRE